MITRLTVPFLDTNILDVTVTAWHKAPGDRVQAGEILADLTTDKATFELESTAGGTLLEILAAAKSIVPSGYILALVGEPGEMDATAAACNAQVMEDYRSAGTRKSEGRGQRANPGIQPGTSSPIRPRATPRARRLAQEHNLDLARIQSETGADVIDEAVLQAYLKK